ncbi:MAG TPA: thiamine pyrophosphate-dependent enzyme [Microvirga sp.]|jgi:thiamine pyrophosphate-dependent acetolactate synthase large subunit-like protein|nr:thiamine pyrophosphate-dependent enzyme [Microvirga sp.]
MDRQMNASTSPALDRREAVRALLAERGDMLVVTGLGSPSYDAFAAGDHDGTFYLWGAMGGAALVGLGLALAQPGRPVVALTGDGEQLMGLGGLATIAAAKPGNLSIVVLDNGRFGETGMQLSHTGLGLDLHRIAEAAGFAAVTEIRDRAGLDAYRGELRRTSGGPRFATVRIRPENPERALPARDGIFLKNRLRGHLGLPVT